MAKVQLTRDVRGRNDDGVRLLFGIYLGMKVFALHPEVIDPVFNFFRLVSLSKLFRHCFLPPVYQNTSVFINSVFDDILLT